MIQRSAPAPRKKRNLRVCFGVERLDFQGRTLDVSETGAFICARQTIEPGTKVRLLIETPAGNLALEGRVVWLCDAAHPPRSPHEDGMGIRWVSTDETFRDFFHLI
jgi:hypothetical protein